MGRKGTLGDNVKYIRQWKEKGTNNQENHSYQINTNVKKKPINESWDPVPRYKSSEKAVRMQLIRQSCFPCAAHQHHISPWGKGHERFAGRPQGFWRWRRQTGRQPTGHPSAGSSSKPLDPQAASFSQNVIASESAAVPLQLNMFVRFSVLSSGKWQ